MNTVLTEKIVRTRNPHNCWGCLREFPRGTRMWLNVIDEKPLTTYYYCMTCTALLQEECRHNHGTFEIMGGELAEMALEKERKRDDSTGNHM